MQLNKVKDLVKVLLETYPELRDSDNRLMLNVWAKQDFSLMDKEKKYRSFSDKFAAGYYHNPESIRRSRQKLQEQYPNLRGKAYKKRQAEQEVVKTQLNAF
jgi:hypothetical protein